MRGSHGQASEGLERTPTAFSGSNKSGSRVTTPMSAAATPENESRLSDVTLDWMARWAAAVPDGLKFDKSVLKVWPQPGGPQHDEVAAGFASIPRWTGLTWSKKYRELPGPGAIMHASVYRRFDSREVRLTDAFGPYRPPTLETHDDFSRFYEPTAPFPANSYNEQTALAGEPPPSA